MLVETAEDWAVSFEFCRDITSKFMKLYKSELPDWLVQAIRIARCEQMRLESILRESWPGGDMEGEQKALEQMRAGQAIGLDEAFAQIAGVSGEEWQQRVQAHKKARRP